MILADMKAGDVKVGIKIYAFRIDKIGKIIKVDYNYRLNYADIEVDWDDGTKSDYLAHLHFRSSEIIDDDLFFISRRKLND